MYDLFDYYLSEEPCSQDLVRFFFACITYLFLSTLFRPYRLHWIIHFLSLFISREINEIVSTVDYGSEFIQFLLYLTIFRMKQSENHQILLKLVSWILSPFSAFTQNAIPFHFFRFLNGKNAPLVVHDPLLWRKRSYSSFNYQISNQFSSQCHPKKVVF